VSFAYAPSRDRVKKVEGATTTYYVEDKLYEHVEDAAGVMTMRHYIGPSVLATLVRRPAIRWATETVSYLHLDRLGSPETITDGLGAVVERHAYDPFGGPRNGSNWTENAWVRKPSVTLRGFTAHEHVDSQRVIHMNGRVYDYRLGRFLSPDPFVVEPLNIQSHNPYSYVLNNPYSGTDPTGYCGYVLRGLARRHCPRGADGDDDSQQIGAHGVRTATTSADVGVPDGGVDPGDSNDTPQDRSAAADDRDEGGNAGRPCNSGCRYRAGKDHQEGQRMIGEVKLTVAAERKLRSARAAEDRRHEEEASRLFIAWAEAVGRVGYPWADVAPPQWIEFAIDEGLEVNLALDPATLLAKWKATHSKLEEANATIERQDQTEVALYGFAVNMMHQRNALQPSYSSFDVAFGLYGEMSLVGGALDLSWQWNATDGTTTTGFQLKPPDILGFTFGPSMTGQYKLGGLDPSP
jgi:RHS repeat-associated protein